MGSPRMQQSQLRLTLSCLLLNLSHYYQNPSHECGKMHGPSLFFREKNTKHVTVSLDGWCPTHVWKCSYSGTCPGCFPKFQVSRKREMLLVLLDRTERNWGKMKWFNDVHIQSCDHQRLLPTDGQIFHCLPPEPTVRHKMCLLGREVFLCSCYNIGQWAGTPLEHGPC